MFHKEIIFALFLSYIFVLGNRQQPVACPTTQDEKQQLVSQKIDINNYMLL